MTDRLRILIVMAEEHRKAILPAIPADRTDVELAGTCRQARHLLKEHDFDLVFTDVSLPDGNWLTISEQSNSGDPLPFLVVCLPREVERVDAIVSSGLVGVLMPPNRRETVQRLLKRALQQKMAGLRRLTGALHCAPQPA